MEYIIKLIAVCVVSVCVSLLLKKSQPELSFVLGTCTALFCFFCAFDLYRQISDRIEQWEGLIALPGEYFIPLMKCLVISIVSQFGVNLCKDAGQAAVASILELSGNVAAMCCILPLIDHLFTLIEEII